MAQDEVVQEMWYSYSRKQESGDGEGAKDNGMEQRLCPIGDAPVGEFLSSSDGQTIFLSSPIFDGPVTQPRDKANEKGSGRGGGQRRSSNVFVSHNEVSGIAHRLVMVSPRLSSTEKVGHRIRLRDNLSGQQVTLISSLTILLQTKLPFCTSVRQLLEIQRFASSSGKMSGFLVIFAVVNGSHVLLSGSWPLHSEDGFVYPS